MSHAAPQTVLDNIHAVARLEKDQEHERPISDRIGDAIGTFAGTITFVLLHLAWFVLWATVNTGLVPGLPSFDPYPFALLTMLVSMEGVLLTTFVLIKQNRASQRADRRDHLDLQINLLTEKEVTKLIQMLEHISAHLGIEREVVDDETRELGEVTAVGELAQEFDDKLPDDP